MKVDESINKVSEMYECAAVLNMGNMNVILNGTSEICIEIIIHHDFGFLFSSSYMIFGERRLSLSCSPGI